LKQNIAIAGATGFIGRWFIDRYKNEFNITALSRKKVANNNQSAVKWKQVDLYSISSTTEALANIDVAIYLVHSMMPSTRLNQGSFEDTDILLADNFSRASEQCNLKQIIYLGGILPKDEYTISKHLQSRYEVEKTLGSRTTPLTSIRAGIIIGPNGSSFRIVQKLVKNLPVMACPEWTKSLNQPIDILDALKIIKSCIGNEKTFNKPLEIGGDQVITYMDLLNITAKKMNKKRLIFSLSFITVGLSKLWVSLITSTSKFLVSPLIESLKHKMTINPENSIDFNINYISVEDSVEKALNSKEKIPINPEFVNLKKEKNTVRSVQRIANPSNRSIDFVARIYPIWLKKRFADLLKANYDGKFIKFSFLLIPLLELKVIKSRSDDNRKLFYITGGWLVKRTSLGWLEFRSVLNNEYMIAGIHEYVPSLPWYIYKYTQAKLHLIVMKRFEKFLFSVPKKYSKNIKQN
jgi:nucleoside-diphosphate-sugar epimerase|tara:strand:+ start:4725 stop:6116 length:1392 start_codon:yes stop_codon:yes gene_type:complete